MKWTVSSTVHRRISFITFKGLLILDSLEEWGPSPPARETALGVAGVSSVQALQDVALDWRATYLRHSCHLDGHTLTPTEEPAGRITLPASSRGNQLTPHSLVNCSLEGLCLWLFAALIWGQQNRC